MSDSTPYKEILTQLVKKQMFLLGPQIALDKIGTVDGIRVSPEGVVEEITKNPNDIFEQILSLFMDFPARIAAKEIIEAKSEQAKQIREQIAAGWLQIESEKAHMIAALSGLSLGFITTNEALDVQFHNPAVEKIFGPAQNGNRTLNEIQNAIGDQFYLPIECNKAIESKAPLQPIDITFKRRRIRFFISPIISISKQFEVVGVTIIIEDMGLVVETTVPLPAQPAVK